MNLILNTILTGFVCVKERGHTRRRFGRIVGIKKGGKTRDDSYTFSNAIRLKGILDYRNLVF